MPAETLLTPRCAGQQPHIVNDTETQNARRLAAAEIELVVLRSSFQRLQERVSQLERLIANGAQGGR